MVAIQHGTVSVSIPDEFALPAKAGNMGADEIQRIARAPRGLGLMCEAAADAMEKSGAKFNPPPGVSAASLRATGKRAEGIDQVIQDVDVIMNRLKQANLLFDAEAWEQIRKTNDQIKAQGKHDPELMVMFKPLLDFFARSPRPTTTAPTQTAPAK